MRKKFFIGTAFLLVCIVVINAFSLEKTVANDNFPEIPELFISENSPYPYKVALLCSNFDKNKVKHNVAYIIEYVYVIQNENTVNQKSIDTALSKYFDKFEKIFETYTYEDFADKNTINKCFQEMKLYLDEEELYTDFKLYFSFTGLYCGLNEGINDDLYLSFDSRELHQFCTDMNIDIVKAFKEKR